MRRARKVEALLHCRPNLFFSGYERIGGQPLFVDRARDAYVWDVDGNRYVDFILGFGTVVLGHADERVTNAVIEALHDGVNPTLLSRRQIELAERIVELVPGARRVTFLKNGSDAVDAAVRLARAFTGRRRVLQWGKHGWHDWCAQNAYGVVEHTRRLTTELRFNDIDYAQKLFRRYGEDIACVVMMPYELEAPRAGFLHELQYMTKANGSLFVLDEVRSGFRIAMGGAQQYFSLEPDLSAFSKAMANGHAISALAGRSAVMKHILKLGLTVTYYRSPDAMAAALATLSILEQERGPDKLACLGTRLMNGVDSAIKSTRVRAAMIGYPSTPHIRFNYENEHTNEKAMRIFCSVMLQRGVLLSPAHHWFVCTSMSFADIDFAVDAALVALEHVETLI